MGDPYLGQIICFGGDYAPLNWAICDGRLLDVGQNKNLFSLLGTKFGGDGVTTFGLPDLRGRMIVGTRPATQYVSARVFGEAGGASTIGLTEPQMPEHTHFAYAVPEATQSNPDSSVTWGGGGSTMTRGIPLYSRTNPGTIEMSDSAIGATGGVTMNSAGMWTAEPHNNMPPYMAITYLICTSGIYPSKKP